MPGALLALVLAAATTGVLAPRSVLPLPATVGRYVNDVAWENSENLLIASDKGVMRYSLRSHAAEQVISTVPLPDGLPDPGAVSSDGISLAATSHFIVGGYNVRLADRKRLMASRVHLMPLDVAVRGQRSCVLAFDMRKDAAEAVWCGPVDRPWSEYKPVHRLSSGIRQFRWVTERFGGAIAMGEDGTLTVVTTLEPGVFHYSADGKRIETLGSSFDELVFSDFREYRKHLGPDIGARYRLFLNAQPLLEDMVLTPRGPALVVRTANPQQTRWALWWPRADKRSVPPTPLGIDRIGPFGHLRCDTRGTAMACVGSLPNKKNAADFRVSEQTPYLWIFELPK
jgi:hypothetical protein